MTEDLSYWKAMRRKHLIESCVYLDEQLDNALVENACFRDEIKELGAKREEVGFLKSRINELERECRESQSWLQEAGEVIEALQKQNTKLERAAFERGAKNK
jgi:hypothetical protein